MPVPNEPGNPAANASGAREAEHAAVLAELQSLPDDGAPKQAAEKTAEDTAVEGAEVEPEEAEAEEPEEQEGADADDDAAEAAEEPEKPRKDEVDPALAKRLEAVQRAEKRAKESVARERQELFAERQRIEREYAPRLEELARFEELKKRAKYDPAGALESLGFGDDDWESTSRQLYARSKAASADPKLREVAAREMRERESSDRLARTERELKQLREERDQERIQVKQQRDVDEYLGRVEKAAGEDAPLVRSRLAKNPSGARRRLTQIAEQLMDETGEVPDPADVVAALEKNCRDELIEIGIDPAAAVKAPLPKKQTLNAGEKKAARTISNDLRSKTSPRKEPLTRKEQEAEVLRALESGTLE